MGMVAFDFVKVGLASLSTLVSSAASLAPIDPEEATGSCEDIV